MLSRERIRYIRTGQMSVESEIKKREYNSGVFSACFTTGADRIVTLDTQGLRVYSEPHGYSDCQAKSFDLKAKNTAPTMHNAAHR